MRIDEMKKKEKKIEKITGEIIRRISTYLVIFIIHSCVKKNENNYFNLFIAKKIISFVSLLKSIKLIDTSYYNLLSSLV